MKIENNNPKEFPFLISKTINLGLGRRKCDGSFENLKLQIKLLLARSDKIRGNIIIIFLNA